LRAYRGTVINRRKVIPTQTVITDVRGQEGEFTLDQNGFQLCRHETKTNCRQDGYRDNDSIKAEYCPEVEQLLKAE
jgi:hypothetical protein